MATTTKSISAAASWAASTSYSVGDYRANSLSQVLLCTTAGTSGSTEPTGTGTGITDGTVAWDYVITRDYSTIGSWETACPADITLATGTDEIWKGELYAHADFDELVTLSGTTTSATNYKHLTSAAGEEPDYINKGTGARIRPTGSSINPKIITVTDQFSLIEKLEISEGCTSTTAIMSGVLATIGGENSTVRYLMIYSLTQPNDFHAKGIDTNDVGVGWDIYRNFVFDIQGGATTRGDGIAAQFWNVTGTCNVYQNTAINCSGRCFDIGAYTTGMTVNVNQNIALNGTLGDYRFANIDYGLGVGTLNIDRNLSSDATAGDTSQGATSSGVFYQNETASAILVNVTSGSEDLHLKASTNAIDNGANLGSPYDIDIDGTIVSGLWDIGADELASALISKAFINEIESQGNVTSVSINNIENSFYVNNLINSQIESLQQIYFASQLSLEFLQFIVSNMSQAMESLASINYLYQVVIESSQIISASSKSNIESLKSIIKSQKNNIESLGFASVSAQYIINYENEGYIAQNIVDYIESMQAVNAAHVLYCESLQSLSSGFVIDFDSIGYVSRSIDGIIECIGTVSSPILTDFESLKYLSGSAQLSIEALTIISTVLQIPIEVLQGANVNIILNIVDKTAYFSMQFDKEMVFSKTVDKTIKLGGNYANFSK